MKVSTKVLSAFVVFTGFFMSTSQVQASVTCTPVTSTGTSAYPYNGKALKCGTTPTAKANGMAGALYDFIAGETDAYNKLSSMGATFYIFNDPTEYDTYFTDLGIPHPAPGTGIPAEAHGATVYDSPTSLIPQYAVIFNKNGLGTSIDTYGNVGWFTTHEAGHFLDYAYKTVVSGVGDKRASTSTMFKDLLAKDWTNFNALPNCGIGGIFNGRKDFYGNYICGGAAHASLPMNGVYNGATNKQVLLLGFGDRFQNEWEIFGNEVASGAGFSDAGVGGLSTYFNSAKFSCTLYLVNRLMATGALPTAANMSLVVKPGGAFAGCPTSGNGWQLP